MAIFDLASHPHAFVTVRELAEYWRLSQTRVLAHMRGGEFEAIQLGPSVYRIRTATALEFERRSKVRSERSRRKKRLAWPSPVDRQPEQTGT